MNPTGIEARLVRLERANRLYRWVLGAMLASGVLLLLGLTDQEPQELRVSMLELVNDEGEQVALLGTRQDIVEFRIGAPGDVPSVHVMAQPAQASVLVNSRPGRKGIDLSCGASIANITLWQPDAPPGSNGSFVNLEASDNRAAISANRFGSSVNFNAGNGASFLMVDRENHYTAEIYAGGSGQLRISNIETKEHLSLGILESGPGLQLYDKDGKVTAKFPGSE